MNENDRRCLATAHSGPSKPGLVAFSPTIAPGIHSCGKERGAERQAASWILRTQNMRKRQQLKRKCLKYEGTFALLVELVSRYYRTELLYVCTPYPIVPCQQRKYAHSSNYPHGSLCGTPSTDRAAGWGTCGVERVSAIFPSRFCRQSASPKCAARDRRMRHICRR